MKELRGKIAIVTGANGGLGGYLTSVLAAEGVDLWLVVYPGGGLDEVQVHARAAAHRTRVRTVVADLRVAAACEGVVTEAVETWGRVDLLVNNAAIEHTSPYHRLTEAQVQDVLSVNLEAPMLLTRRVLPGMLERRCGHIINMASLAGKSGPACQEPYAATKAGLIAFTFSLRGTYQGTGVSASVICPGFVEAGIYARIKDRTGCTAPLLLGAVRPERVARAVLRAIRDDVPEIVITRYPVRPLLALTALAPSLGLWLTAKLGGHAFFRQVAQAQQRSPVQPSARSNGAGRVPRTTSRCLGQDATEVDLDS